MDEKSASEMNEVLTSFFVSLTNEQIELSSITCIYMSIYLYRGLERERGKKTLLA